MYGHLLNFGRNRTGDDCVLYTIKIDCEHRREESSSTFSGPCTPRRCSVRRVVYSLLREYLARIDTLDSREETLVTLQVHGTHSVTNSPGRLSVSGDMWAPARWSRRKAVPAFELQGFERQLHAANNCLSRNPLKILESTAEELNLKT